MEGILLLENNAPRYFYQTKEKSINGEFSRANYIHPLYSLNGEPLTEDFPEDHLHHRGIFWSWHQLYSNGERIGDSWLMEGIILKVEDKRAKVNGGNAKLYSEVLWVQESNQVPIMKENVTITYERLEKEVFALTFDIELTALIEGLEIGGSEDEKGYGGFSVRLKLPEDVVFNSEQGKVEPQDLPVQGGAWIQLSGDFDASEMEDLGIVIMAEPYRLPSYRGGFLEEKQVCRTVPFQESIPGNIQGQCTEIQKPSSGP
jgi:hypothetical protein